MINFRGAFQVYYEPQGNAPIVLFDTVIQDDGFVMPFKAHLKKIELDPEGIVMPLLRQVREMVDKGVVPDGRDGCEDCKRMGEVVDMVGRTEEM